VPARPAILRVMFFIDGQNLYHGCLGHFGHGHCRVDLLAARILHGRQLAGIRYYTGIHDPRVDPLSNAVMSRRLQVMRDRGVYVYTHPLKYSNQHRADRVVPPCEHGFRKVDVVRRGREKGIDLRIGLDMLRLARHGEFDVAVLVSQDTDLNQAVDELLDLREELDRWLVVENAFPYATTSGKPKFRLQSCARWHVIDEAMFERIRDDADYTKPLRA